jgi:Leucine-rich repeat (LRR) protein
MSHPTATGAPGEREALQELVRVGQRPVVVLAHERDRPPGVIGTLVRDGAITVLVARGCDLVVVPDSLGTLAHLDRLEVSGNRLTRVPATGVRELYAFDNELVALPAIGDRMRVLDVSVNQLAELPPLAGVEILYAARNRLSALPAVAPRLRYLNLDENPLTALDGVAALGELQELRLIGNRLTALPDALGRLGKLRELYLRGNALAALPPALGALDALEVLDLRDNQLAEIPAELGALSQLLHLDLRSNRLDDLPASIGELPHLRKLDLRWNPLRRRPAWLEALEARGCAVFT